MLPNKTFSSLQKTYDECYLICSTAVYFEGKDNEAEALRSWRSALDQIYYHNAYRVPVGYVPKSETEKALKDSLRDMEMQCKERVDLLEALWKSRQEQATVTDGGYEEPCEKTVNNLSRSLKPRLDVENNERGFVGNGTIPAVNYPDNSRPLRRPPTLSKCSAELAAVGNKLTNTATCSRTVSPTQVATFLPGTKKASRSSSPEKRRTMKHTLRSSDKIGRKSGSKTAHKTENPVTNKAATLAWQSLGRSGKDNICRGLDTNTELTCVTPPDLRRATSSSEASHMMSDPQPKSRYDSKTRTIIYDHQKAASPQDLLTGKNNICGATARSNSYPFPSTDVVQKSGTSDSMFTRSVVEDLVDLDQSTPPATEPNSFRPRRCSTSLPNDKFPGKFEPVSYLSYFKEYPETNAIKNSAESELSIRCRPLTKGSSGKEHSPVRVSRKPLVIPTVVSSRNSERQQEKDNPRRNEQKDIQKPTMDEMFSRCVDDDCNSSESAQRAKKKPKQKQRQRQKENPVLTSSVTTEFDGSDASLPHSAMSAWELKVKQLMKNLPKGVDEEAAKQIFDEIVVQGDEVHWSDVAGLEIAKNALKEAVVYPFLRPDLFMGLREPARGMLLFGPPGTGKTMLARAVATESKSTFFSISASSLTSKYLGESEKLVRALFQLAKALAPSIIFVDEIDSLLSSRSGSGENESTRRIKTEFLIQWSDLQRAAAGREQTEKERDRGDASRVLVLAATNLPWAIDEAARRRFVRRQYIPLPEDETRTIQLRTLLSHQKHSLNEGDMRRLVRLTEGFSGSDVTALAKDAAMGPLRSLGEALLFMTMDQIRPIQFVDFEASLINIRPSVSKQGLKEFEDWAREFGERGG